jgi:hypothetical protein
MSVNLLPEFKEPTRREEPKTGDLIFEVETKRILVIEYISDGMILDGALRWYVNYFGNGEAAGTLAIEDWRDSERYWHLGKLDYWAWRRALEELKTPKLACLDESSQ